MDWMDALGDTQGRLVRLVRGEPRSVSDLAEALGISSNAVRTHVAALERDGWLRGAGVRRGTGGKPARLYELAPSAEEQLPKAYGPVLGELVSLLREETGGEGVASVLRHVGRRLGAAAGVDGTDETRVRAAAALLDSLGGSVTVRSVDGGWMLDSAGCPLSAVVREAPEACALAESLVAEVTGREVKEQCRRGERPRCAFRVSSRGAEAAASS